MTRPQMTLANTGFGKYTKTSVSTRANKPLSRHFLLFPMCFLAPSTNRQHFFQRNLRGLRPISLSGQLSLRGPTRPLAGQRDLK